jgi:IMP cyclohydrolase
MNILDLNEILTSRPYPGRGILLGQARNGAGAQAVMAYFIMGRSENSRNRVFEETEDGIRTRAYDESKMTDPSLIIYHPVRMVESTTIVTNGDQTDTIRDALAEGRSYIDALRTRTYEPDEPNYTPRISGLMYRDGSYALSILKSLDGDPEVCQRNFYEYSANRAQTGHFISTYEGFGDPRPSFSGEPVKVSITAQTADELADQLWSSLNEDNKVSLFVRYINLGNGCPETVIINKHGQRTHTAPDPFS